MKTRILLALAAAGLMASCGSPYPSIEAQAPFVIGSGAEQHPDAVVVSTVQIKDEDGNTGKIVGGVTGAAIGAGTGQLLGGGRAQAVSATGFGALGTLLGVWLGSQVDEGGVTSERITVRYGRNKQVTFTQSIFKEYGPLQAGTTGTLYINGDRYTFLPY